MKGIFIRTSVFCLFRFHLLTVVNWPRVKSLTLSPVGLGVHTETIPGRGQQSTAQIQAVSWKYREEKQLDRRRGGKGWGTGSLTYPAPIRSQRAFPVIVAAPDLWTTKTPAEKHLHAGSEHAWLHHVLTCWLKTEPRLFSTPLRTDLSRTLHRETLTV